MHGRRKRDRADIHSNNQNNDHMSTTMTKKLVPTRNENRNDKWNFISKSMDEYLNHSASLKLLRESKGSMAVWYFQERLLRSLCVLSKSSFVSPILLQRSFQIWRNLFKVQRNAAFRKEMGSRRLKFLIFCVYISSIQSSFHKWKAIWHNEYQKRKHSAALLIQKLFLIFLGKQLFIRIYHRESIVHHPLQNVSLSHLKVPKYYRFHRDLLLERRRIVVASICVQKYLRMWSTKGRYIFVINKIVRWQSLSRGRIASLSYHKCKFSATRIQTWCRKWISRLNFFAFVRALKCMQCKLRFQLIRSAGIHIQQIFRSYLNRKRACHQKFKEYQAALVLQRHWYHSNKQFSTFVLLICLRIVDEVDRGQERKIFLFYNAVHAKRIQRRFRSFWKLKKKTSALTIQSLVRTHLCKKLLQRLMGEKLIHENENKSSYVIAFFWLRLKKKRLRRHFHLIRLNEERINQQKMVTRIQSFLRTKLARNNFHRLCRKRRLKGLILSYMTYKRKEMMRSNVIKRTSYLLVSSLVKLSIEEQSTKITESYSNSTLLLQKWWIGRLYRYKLEVKMKELSNRYRAEIVIKRSCILYFRSTKSRIDVIRTKRKNCLRIYLVEHSIRDIHELCERTISSFKQCSKVDIQEVISYIHSLALALEVINETKVDNFDGIDEGLNESYRLILLSERNAKNLSSRLVISVCRSLCSIIESYFCRFRAARSIQIVSRMYLAKRHLLHLKTKAFLKSSMEDYISDRRTNHVNVVWTNFRIEEAEKYRKYLIDCELGSVMRYGWVILSEENGEKYCCYVKGKHVKSSTFPSYTLGEYEALSLINRVMRRFLALKEKRRLLHIKLRETRKGGYWKIWNESKRSNFLFTFEEEWSSLSIQCAWRIKKAKEKFNLFLRSECLSTIVLRAVKKASGLSWYGYGYEGMSLSLWLARMGCDHEVSLKISRYLRTKKSSNANAFADEKQECTSSSKTLARWHDIQDFKEFVKICREEVAYHQLELAIGSKDYRNLFIAASLFPSSIPDQLKFLNFFQSPYDPRSLKKCIEDSRELLFLEISKKFRNNPQRARKISEEVIRSNFPVTKGQITAYLKRYDGKPGLAQRNCFELLNIQTTSTLTEEKQAFYCLINGCERALLVLKRIKVWTLEKLVRSTVDRANDIFRNGNDSAYKAALILRKEVIDEILTWHSMSKLVQRIYRGFLQRRLYIQIMNDRNQCATVIQSHLRRLFSKQTEWQLRRQQRAKYEQFREEKTSRFFWYNKSNNVRSWDEPSEPYRPMVYSQSKRKWVQAWPQLDVIEHCGKATDGLKCTFCKEETARRSCSKCLVEGRPSFYCRVCFEERHRLIEDHQPTCIISPPDKFTCCLCGNPSTRKCFGTLIDEQTRKSLHEIVNAANRSDEIFLTKETFFSVVSTHLQLDISKSLLGILYEDFRKVLGKEGGPFTFWNRFRCFMHAQENICNEHFCLNCWKRTHKSGSRSKHKFVAYKENCPVCSQCEELPARRTCLQCQDEFCVTCYQSQHKAGKRRLHTYNVIAENLGPGEVFCHFCRIISASNLCKNCGGRFCDSCITNHWKNCSACDLIQNGISPISCSLCDNPPDTICFECNAVYCSQICLGKQGCFRRSHQKGSKVFHEARSLSTFISDTYARYDRTNDHDEENLPVFTDEKVFRTDFISSYSEINPIFSVAPKSRIGERLYTDDLLQLETQLELSRLQEIKNKHEKSNIVPRDKAGLKKSMIRGLINKLRWRQNELFPSGCLKVISNSSGNNQKKP